MTIADLQSRQPLCTVAVIKSQQMYRVFQRTTTVQNDGALIFSFRPLTFEGILGTRKTLI